MSQRSGVPYHKVGVKEAVYPTMSGSQKSDVPYHKWEIKSKGLS